MTQPGFNPTDPYGLSPAPSGRPPQTPQQRRSQTVKMVAGIGAVVVAAAGIVLFANHYATAEAVPQTDWNTVAALPQGSRTPSASQTPTASDSSPAPGTTTSSPTTRVSRSSAATTTATTASKAPVTSYTLSTVPKATDGTDCTSGTVTTSAWSAKIPTGWTCEGSASGAQFWIFSPTQKSALVLATSTAPAATACSTELTAQGGTVSADKDTTWGGKTAKSATATVLNLKFYARCVTVGSTTYVLKGSPGLTDGTEAIAGLTAIMGGWTWK